LRQLRGLQSRWSPRGRYCWCCECWTGSARGCARRRASRRGLAFGLHRAFDNAGAVVGPLLAAALLAWQVPIRNILLWAMVPGALTVALALTLREPATIDIPPARRPEWAWRTLPPAFRRVLTALALFTLGQASNAFILLRASEIGMPPTRVALLWAAVAATSTLLAVPLSALSDRVGRIPLLVAGWSMHALLFVALALVGQPALLWPIAILIGLYMAATEGAERALIADLVGREMLGTAYGWYYLTKGLLLLPASAVFGWIWYSTDASTAFFTAASLVAAATVLLALWVLPAVRARNS
jgi:MFS family permease